MNFKKNAQLCKMFCKFHFFCVPLQRILELFVWIFANIGRLFVWIFAYFDELFVWIFAKTAVKRLSVNV